MKKVTSKSNRINRSLPSLVAVGGSLVALPSAALELGDLTVHSRLGQPLRASIAFALAPNEQLSDYCISTRPGAPLGALPGVGPATVRVANGAIVLSGSTAIREPMLATQVLINCPYAANISREYMLFVDPATPAYEPAAIAQRPATETAVAVTPPTAPPRAAEQKKSAPRQSVDKDITAVTRYQVRFGDSLSGIAQRIENRPVGLWPAANAIFAANPDAFVDNDPNRLKTGSWLSIPAFAGSGAVRVVAAAAASTVVAELAGDEPAAAGNDVSEDAVIEIADVMADDTQAGDVAVSEDAYVAADAADAAAESIVIPDTALAEPETTSTSPNVPTAVIATGSNSTVVARESGSPAWLLWLAGSGVAVFLALLVFGRRLRSGSDATPVAAVATESMRRRTDIDSGNGSEDLAPARVEYESVDYDSDDYDSIDYDLTDESPTEENLALDANLFIGSGFDNGTEMDVVEDFAFVGSSQMDIELPFEPQTETTEMPVLAPLQTSEDEMTATLALNEEIRQAAAELAGQIYDVPDTGVTPALPLATVTELQFSDADDTGVNEALTIELVAEEKTVEMPATRDDDDTAEMKLKSG